MRSRTADAGEIDAHEAGPPSTDVLEADEICALGPTVVVAPHPDDESIGCGGLIALLAQRRVPVQVVLVSDGTMSHPGSRRFPAPVLRALRVEEMRSALAALGIVGGDRDGDDAHRSLIELGCRDGAVPGPGEPGFAAATAMLAVALRRFGVRSVLAPWRRDPHPDHRAASAMAQAAIAAVARGGGAAVEPRLLEYTVWAAERGDAASRPGPGEARETAFDIAAVVDRKLAAVAAHRSQCGGLIDDDPGGFVLPAAMRARCAEPVERYLEVVATAPRRSRS